MRKIIILCKVSATVTAGNNLTDSFRRYKIKTTKTWPEKSLKTQKNLAIKPPEIDMHPKS